MDCIYIYIIFGKEQTRNCNDYIVTFLLENVKTDFYFYSH